MAFLCNCHTHIGDAFIHLPQKRWTVNSLVAPPTGYKHQRLQEASLEKIQHGITAAANIMKACGTTHFIDFREGGVSGVQALQTLDLPLKAIILGRPTGLKYSKQEIDALLDITDGIALSGTADWDYSLIMQIADHVHSVDKVFALHVSEHLQENMEDVLSLRPTFVVHLCCTTEDDLDLIADAKVPVIVCPRANAFFGLRPPIEAMLERDISLMLGTDNAMIVPPNIKEEIVYVKQHFFVSSQDIDAMVTTNPRKCLNVIGNIHEAD